LRVNFDRRLKLKFLDSQVTTDAGLLASRELHETFGLTEVAVPRQLFREIFRRIGWLKTKRLLPAPG
jgi:hypothetical protein